jgi:hypothetical protein
MAKAHINIESCRINVKAASLNAAGLTEKL